MRTARVVTPKVTVQNTSSTTTSTSAVAGLVAAAVNSVRYQAAPPPSPAPPLRAPPAPPSFASVPKVPKMPNFSPPPPPPPPSAPAFSSSSSSTTTTENVQKGEMVVESAEQEEKESIQEKEKATVVEKVESEVVASNETAAKEKEEKVIEVKKQEPEEEKEPEQKAEQQQQEEARGGEDLQKTVDEIRLIYRRYAGSNQHMLPSALQKYKGKESELLEKVRNKYLPSSKKQQQEEQQQDGEEKSHDRKEVSSSFSSAEKSVSNNKTTTKRPWRKNRNQEEGLMEGEDEEELDSSILQPEGNNSASSRHRSPPPPSSSSKKATSSSPPPPPAFPSSGLPPPPPKFPFSTASTKSAQEQVQSEKKDSEKIEIFGSPSSSATAPPPPPSFSTLTHKKKMDQQEDEKLSKKSTAESQQAQLEFEEMESLLYTAETKARSHPLKQQQQQQQQQEQEEKESAKNNIEENEQHDDENKVIGIVSEDEQVPFAFKKQLDQAEQQEEQEQSPSSSLRQKAFEEARQVNRESGTRSLEEEMKRFVAATTSASAQVQSQEEQHETEQEQEEDHKKGSEDEDEEINAMIEMVTATKQKHQTQSPSSPQNQKQQQQKQQKSDVAFFPTLSSCEDPVAPEFVGPLVQYQVEEATGIPQSATFVREAKNLSELLSEIEKIVQIANSVSSSSPLAQKQQQVGEKGEGEEERNLRYEPFLVFSHSQIPTFAPVWRGELLERKADVNRVALKKSFIDRDNTLQQLSSSYRPIVAVLRQPADGLAAEFALCCRNFVSETENAELTFSQLRCGVLPSPTTIVALSNPRTDEEGEARNISLRIPRYESINNNNNNVHNNDNSSTSSSSSSSSFVAAAATADIARIEESKSALSTAKDSLTNTSNSFFSKMMGVFSSAKQQQEEKGGVEARKEYQEDGEGTVRLSGEDAQNRELANLLKFEYETFQRYVSSLKNTPEDEEDRASSSTILSIVEEFFDLTKDARATRSHLENLMIATTHHVPPHSSLSSSTGNKLQVASLDCVFEFGTNSSSEHEQQHQDTQIKEITEIDEDEDLNKIEIILTSPSEKSKSVLSELVVCSELFLGVSVERGKMKSSSKHTEPPLVVIVTESLREAQPLLNILPPQRTVLAITPPPQASSFPSSSSSSSCRFVEVICAHSSTTEESVRLAMQLLEKQFHIPCVHSRPAAGHHQQQQVMSVTERMTSSLLTVYAELCTRRSPLQIQQVLSQNNFQVTPLELWQSLGPNRVRELSAASSASVSFSSSLARANNRLSTNNPAAFFSSKMSEKEQKFLIVSSSSSSSVSAAHLPVHLRLYPKEDNNNKNDHNNNNNNKQKLLVPPSVEESLHWIPSDQDIVDALAAALVHEACLALDSNLVSDTLAADALTLSVGFPLHLAGALQYASSSSPGGKPEFIQKMSRLQNLLGLDCVSPPQSLLKY